MLLNSVDVSIGHRVRALREQKSLSAIEMSCKLQVSLNVLEAWEAGVLRMRAKDLFRFTAVLEVPLSSLFEWTGDRLTIAKNHLS